MCKPAAECCSAHISMPSPWPISAQTKILTMVCIYTHICTHSWIIVSFLFMYVGNWDLASWGSNLVNYELNEAWYESRGEIMIIVAYSWINFTLVKELLSSYH